MQVERGYLRAPRQYRACQLRPDWDWHRLIAALKPRGAMERELKRLVMREGFQIHAGSWETAQGDFTRQNFPSLQALRKLLQGAPRNHWAGFQIFYPMGEDEVRSATGADLVESMLAVFREVAPAINLTMQIRLEEKGATDF